MKLVGKHFWKLLSRLNSNLVLAIPAMMLLGFFVGLLFDSDGLTRLILPFTFMMVYPMMIGLNIKELFTGGDLKAQLIAQSINFTLIPMAGFLLGLLFFPNHPYLALGLLLAALVPTSGMTIAWTGFAKGNLAAAVKMTVLGLLLGSLLSPFYIQFLLGAQVAVDLVAVFRQIALVVLLPMLAGYVTRRYLLKKHGQPSFKQDIAPRLPGLSALGVLGIVFVAIALKAKDIAAQPELLLQIMIPLLLLYSFNYLLSTLLGRHLLPPADGIALVFGTVMRNLSIALAIAINAFGAAGAEAALVIALAYIIQVQSAAWYVKLVPRLFDRQEN